MAYATIRYEGSDYKIPDHYTKEEVIAFVKDVEDDCGLNLTANRDDCGNWFVCRTAGQKG